MVLIGLVAAMLAVIAMGYWMHETAPLPADRPTAAGSASSESGTVRDEPLAAQTLITIKSYDETAQTYVIFPTKFPGEGDGTVTPTALANAIDTIKLDQIMRDPLSVVGKSYQCDKPLELISWEG